VRRIETSLPGLVVIEPVVHGDERGFFLESYRRDALASLGITDEWVQDNHSRSVRGVIRGMHFALPPGQAKLIRCVRGAILDVCVDIRRGSPTFGKWDAVELDDRSARMLYIPVGFAHGYCVTSEVADVVYKCSAYYDPVLEREIALDDPDLAIAWPEGPRILSERDRGAPRLTDVADALPFAFDRP
jgi:dTDP-4-dehydrorhamnose 3,5-epimerase